MKESPMNWQMFFTNLLNAAAKNPEQALDVVDKALDVLTTIVATLKANPDLIAEFTKQSPS